MGTAPKRFGIALSFPGERRDFVAQVAERLAGQIGRERVLYDHYYEAEFARPDLDTWLQRLYHDESELIAVFLCADYERKEWCGLEWRALRDLIKRRQSSAIMPLRFDATQIPGLFSTDGYVWIGDGRGPLEVADLILERWRINTGQTGTKPPPTAAPQPRIDLTKLPFGAADFLGRESELQWLDDAWSDPRTSALELTAPGGVGKTALVKRWLDRLRADGWRGAELVYGWSFYSQGTGDDRQASDDSFLSTALDWFEVAHDPASSPWDKGKLLAQAVAARRTLLVLDGVEPLQYPPGPMAGRLRAPGLQALLAQLTGGGQPGLCILTTRERVQDLAEYERGPDRPDGTVVRQDLANLSAADGARLLHRLRVHHAGSATIAEDDPELIAAAREVRGHALTLTLLGGYLAQAHGGDCRQRDLVDLADADATQGGHAFRVMAAYETWFGRAGGQGARELAALRLLGFFDRPADAGCLAALRQAPPMAGLTEPLSDLSTAQWHLTLSRLSDGGLIEPPPADRTGRQAPAVDAHPLVREYLGKRLREAYPDGWREGHRRLYEHLKASVPYRPDGVAGLQPLYQAVAHGCLAELQREACDEVYRDRILRGTRDADGFYSTKNLGAFAGDLGAVACFFEEPWQRLPSTLSDTNQAWLRHQAAIRLRALGRLSEALEPMRAALVGVIHHQDWGYAAGIANNLSELELCLGRVADAVQDGEQSLVLADRSTDGFQRMTRRATLADALHQQGRRQSALVLFAEAEAIQAERRPTFPFLYGLPNFRYCTLLLAKVERTAWGQQLDRSMAEESARVECIDTCCAVERRTRQTLDEWLRRYTNVPTLDLALHPLTLGRTALLRGVLQAPLPETANLAFSQAADYISASIDGMRASGRQDYIPLGLLPRAWLHALMENPAAARADLDEALQIASRGGMRLFMADCHLHRARLFRNRAELTRARALIEQCGYWRRREELEDAEAAAPGWPDAI